MTNTNYKAILPQIKTFIFDVDGVLTDGTIMVTTEGEMYRNFNIKDGYALKTAMDLGYNICIISGGSNEGVRKRLQHLGIKDIYLRSHNKIEQLNDYFSKNNITDNQTLYMGDDIPDFPVMKMVALPCCPQVAVPEIKAISKYISHKKGGQGAVRDVIEQVLKVQGKWNGNYSAKYD